MRALGLGAFLQHRRASGPRRRPTSGPRPRVPHVADPGCVGVEASTPHQPWFPSRDSSGTPVGTLLGVSLSPYACSAPPPLRARVKGRVGVSPRERDAVRVRVGCGWCSTRRLSLCAVAGWLQQQPSALPVSSRRGAVPMHVLWSGTKPSAYNWVRESRCVPRVGVLVEQLSAGCNKVVLLLCILWP